MKVLKTKTFRIAKWAVAVLLIGHFEIIAEPQDLDIGAAGWIQYGVIEKSSDTTGGQNLNGKANIMSGAQFSIDKSFSEKFAIRVGLGAAAVHSMAGNLQNGGYAPMNVFPYVAEAGFGFEFINTESSQLKLRGGLIPFDYAPENRNLGLYLLRGSVYPGYIYSGFETKHVMPVANMLGLHLHHNINGFYQDVIINSETDLAPFFDLSPALIVGYELENIFRIGAGVNFYHLIPVDDSVTNSRNWIYEDTARDANGAPVLDANSNVLMDTTFLSFQGTKVMANAAIDFKGLFGGIDAMGPEDLKLYSEVAILGLDNSKAIREIYGDYSERMPFMIGFNFPVFNILNHLALELQWYNAPFRDNLDGYKNTADPNSPSPLPYTNNFDNWIDRDDFKFSIHGAKVIQNHVKISFQIANDHYRPGIFAGYGDNAPSGKQAVMLRSPSGANLFSEDWYWMTKVAFFF